jgi:hypothetical protein
MLSLCACAASAFKIVDVSVRQTLNVPASTAARAWVETVWRGGGGLLGVIVKELPTTASGADSSSPAGPRRLVLPLMLEETLVREPTCDDDGICSLEYVVTGTGLMGTDLVAGSHSGSVRFVSCGASDCEMTWDVSFKANEVRHALWQRVTELTIGETCNNFAACCATPLVYEASCCLAPASSSSSTATTTATAPATNLDDPAAGPSRVNTPAAARDAWLRYVWALGGGLPIPPPILLTPEGVGCERLQLPPGLRERVEEVEGADAARSDGASTSVAYRVLNPGPLTYQVSDHKGRVHFSRGADGAILMRWLVAVRPLPRCEGLVRWFTDLIVGTLSRNLATHCRELGAPSGEATLADGSASASASGAVTAVESGWRTGAVDGDREMEALIDELRVDRV